MSSKKRHHTTSTGHHHNSSYFFIDTIHRHQTPGSIAFGYQAPITFPYGGTPERLRNIPVQAAPAEAEEMPVSFDEKLSIIPTPAPRTGIAVEDNGEDDDCNIEEINEKSENLVSAVVGSAVVMTNTLLEDHIIYLKFQRDLIASFEPYDLRRLLVQAEARYAMYLRLLQRLCQDDETTDAIVVPPWDVALIFHAHIMHPSFHTDMTNTSQSLLTSSTFSFPLSTIASMITAEKWTDETSQDIWNKEYPGSTYQLLTAEGEISFDDNVEMECNRCGDIGRFKFDEYFEMRTDDAGPVMLTTSSSKDILGQVIGSGNGEGGVDGVGGSGERAKSLGVCKRCGIVVMKEKAQVAAMGKDVEGWLKGERAIRGVDPTSTSQHSDLLLLMTGTRFPSLSLSRSRSRSRSRSHHHLHRQNPTAPPIAAAMSSPEFTTGKKTDLTSNLSDFILTSRRICAAGVLNALEAELKAIRRRSSPTQLAHPDLIPYVLSLYTSGSVYACFSRDILRVITDDIDIADDEATYLSLTLDTNKAVDRYSKFVNLSKKLHPPTQRRPSENDIYDEPGCRHRLKWDKMKGNDNEGFELVAPSDIEFSVRTARLSCNVEDVVRLIPARDDLGDDNVNLDDLRRTSLAWYRDYKEPYTTNTELRKGFWSKKKIIRGLINPVKGVRMVRDYRDLGRAVIKDPELTKEQKRRSDQIGLLKERFRRSVG